MSTSSQKLFSANLKTKLGEVGFVKSGALGAIRFRDPFVDRIEVQTSRWGDSYYLHHSVTVAADMMIGKSSSYSVGTRLQHGADVAWNVTATNSIEQVFSSIFGSVNNDSLLFFENITRYQDYLFEVFSNPNFNEKNISLDSLIAFVGSGKSDRAFHICNDIMETQFSETRRTKERHIQLQGYASVLRNSIEAGTHEDIVMKWKAERAALLTQSKSR
jgi:hypothetical protein